MKKLINYNNNQLKMEPIIDGVIRELGTYRMYSIISFNGYGKECHMNTILAKSLEDFWIRSLKKGIIFGRGLKQIRQDIVDILYSLDTEDYTVKDESLNDNYVNFVINYGWFEVCLNKTSADDIFLETVKKIFVRDNVACLSMEMKKDNIKSNIFVRYHEMLGDDDANNDVSHKFRCAITLLLDYFSEPNKLLDFFVSWDIISDIFEKYNTDLYADIYNSEEALETMEKYEHIKVSDVELI